MAGKPGMRSKIHPTRAAQVRETIRAVQIVERLQIHVLGDHLMTPSQVTAALGLLKKYLPDLAAPN